MKYPLAVSTWGEEEKEAIYEVVESGMLTMGEKVKQFEKEFADYHNVKYAVMTSSGSTANLLGASALKYTDKYDIKERDQVIVPAIGWSTTYFPFHQLGYELVFVDVDRSLCMKPAEVERRINRKTKAICVVNTLGFPANFAELSKLCDAHNLLYIEDNCEGLGAYTYDGGSEPPQLCGTLGVYGTFSFFFSHHIQTIEGGMLITDDEELYHTALILRTHGWIRDLPNINKHYTKTGDEFSESWKFVLPGYNLRPSDINGAIGSIQLKKLDGFLDQRRKNAQTYQRVFVDSDYCSIFFTEKGASWFHFPFILTGPLKHKRQEVLDVFKQRNIDTRPIVSGNFINNPVISKLNCVYSNIELAEKVDKFGFMIGNNHTDLTRHLYYAREAFESCL